MENLENTDNGLLIPVLIGIALIIFFSYQMIIKKLTFKQTAAILFGM